MQYRIAGIDVHKRMLAVVVADVAADGEYQFERRTVGTSPEQLRQLAAWFVEQHVDEVVMDRRRNTGGRCGRRLSGVRKGPAGRIPAPGRRQGRCTWRRPNRTAGR